MRRELPMCNACHCSTRHENGTDDHSPSSQGILDNWFLLFRLLRHVNHLFVGAVPKAAIMFEWFKSLFTSGKTVIYIDRVMFPCGYCPKPKPGAPAKPVLRSGDSVTMIKYPVSVPTGGPDVVKTIVKLHVDGQPDSTVEIPSNGGDTFVTVPEGSNGSVCASYADAAGNVSADSPEAVFTNASDTTPPAAPAGAPTLGAGDTV